MKAVVFHGATQLNWRGVKIPLLLGLVLFLAVPLGVQAHARMVRSSPPNQAKLAQAPAQLEVWFNELLEDGFNSVKVFPAQQVNELERTSLVKGKPSLDPNDPTRLSVKLKPLPPGDYMVEWRVLSRDGHSAPGRLTFRVLAPQRTDAPSTGRTATMSAEGSPE